MFWPQIVNTSRILEVYQWIPYLSTISHMYLVIVLYIISEKPNLAPPAPSLSIFTTKKIRKTREKASFPPVPPPSRKWRENSGEGYGLEGDGDEKKRNWKKLGHIHHQVVQHWISFPPLHNPGVDFPLHTCVGIHSPLSPPGVLHPS